MCVFLFSRAMITYSIGVKYVRGGELFEFMDEENVALNDPTRLDKTSPY